MSGCSKSKARLKEYFLGLSGACAQTKGLRYNYPAVSGLLFSTVQSLAADY